MTKRECVIMILEYLKDIYQDPEILGEFESAINVLKQDSSGENIDKAIEILDFLAKQYDNYNVRNCLNSAIIKLKKKGDLIA